MTVASTRPARPAPTARGERAEQALSAAVLELLAEHGFGALTVDGIAARAKVGKPTIYRRWENKEALIADVLGNLDPPDAVPAEGDLRETLVAILANLRGRLTDTRTGRIWQRLIGEAESYPEIVELYQRQYLAPRREAIARLLEHHRAAGRLRPDLDVDAAVEILTASMLGTLVAPGRGAETAPGPEAIVELLLGGMLTR